MPFPAGGIADVFARIIGGCLGEAWGQPVVVENRAGAGENIGAELVAKRRPTGIRPSRAASALRWSTRARTTT